MAVTDAGGDQATKALTQAGSMDATNTIAKDPPFKGIGSESAATYGIEITPELPPIPETADANTAGNGDKGGVWHVDGVDPRSDGPWTQANSAADGDGSKWTASQLPFDYQNI